MSHIVEINSIEQLSTYCLLWKRLLQQTPGASFFQSLDWLEVYWQHYGDRQKLRVLIVSSGDQPIGILPLAVITEKTRIGNLRVLTYPLNDWGTFHGPIGPHPAATLLAGMRHIRQTRRDFDMIDLRWIDTQRHDRDRTARAMQQVGLKATESEWAKAAIVDIDGSWDDYWMARKSHWRTNVRCNAKKLATDGEITYVRYRPLGSAHGDDDPRWDLYEACLRVARNSWQANSTSDTTISHDEISEFLHDVHLAAVQSGSLDLNLLLIDGKPVAFAYNYHFQGNVSGLRSGFDSSISRHGPGSVLLHKMIEDSFARGDDTLDLGPNYYDCKRHWATSQQSVGRLTHYPSTVAIAQAVRIKRWAWSLMGRETGLRYGTVG